MPHVFIGLLLSLSSFQALRDYDATQAESAQSNWLLLCMLHRRARCLTGGPTPGTGETTGRVAVSCKIIPFLSFMALPGKD